MKKLLLCLLPFTAQAKDLPKDFCHPVARESVAKVLDDIVVMSGKDLVRAGFAELAIQLLYEWHMIQREDPQAAWVLNLWVALGMILPRDEMIYYDTLVPMSLLYGQKCEGDTNGT